MLFNGFGNKISMAIGASIIILCAIPIVELMAAPTADFLEFLLAAIVFIVCKITLIIEEEDCDHNKN